MARSTSLQTITATSAACVVRPLRYGRNANSAIYPDRLINPATNLPFLEAASQDFKAGDLVYLNGGAVTEVQYAQTVPIAGLALTDATTVTGSQIEIMPIYPEVEYIMHVTHNATETTCIPTTIALLMGNMYGLCAATVNYTAGHPKFLLGGGTVYSFMIDKANTLPRILITGLVENPDIISTTTLIPVYCKFPRIFTKADYTEAYKNLQF
jgi:hypothetical protein